MSNPERPEPGSITWTDLTVDHAEEVRDFYQAVVGWQPKPVNMGDYDDFAMKAPGSGDSIAGICHARGENASLPAQWLIYIDVEDLDDSMEKCRQQGGEVIVGPRGGGGQRYCVIRDPAGAVAALFQQGEDTPRDEH